MNEMLNEKLSAFIDNELTELDERRVLSELQRDEALRGTWERYHLIRAALRNELGSEHGGAPPVRVSTAVAHALDREPAHRNRRVLAKTLGKALGGLAIAASVATVAILMLQAPSGPSDAERTALVPAAGTVQPIVPVSDNNGVLGARAPAAAADLNAYLLEHSEFAPTTDIGNMLPYVRTINRDNAQSK